MKIIYGVYRNADDIEGRGPMVLDTLFINREDAVLYMDNQPGVMGRRQQWSRKRYGDWKLEELELIESAGDIEGLAELKQSRLRQSALSKLTPEERAALNLSN